jgi:hypothetical protein
MGVMSERRLKALHAAEYDEDHYLRVRNALEALDLPATDDVVLALGHAVLSHPAASSKLRQLADIWSILGNARTITRDERIVFEVL